ncbi:predicted protein [Lichtheimia corymbifera JMRC:FSU:9682]|uniref:Uncharacterized protein n=1 Tax=Lichtheimia corymbifera JMRC:FSU:9682 TaxID=1263082 RepID=A0A068SIN4_9FUNG|nr:predicted protein [Lichtheimia corymbifera JMRC:FSU:9682]
MAASSATRVWISYADIFQHPSLGATTWVDQWNWQWIYNTNSNITWHMRMNLLWSLLTPPLIEITAKMGSSGLAVDIHKRQQHHVDSHLALSHFRTTTRMHRLDRHSMYKLP